MESRDLLVKTHFGDKTNEAQKSYMTAQSHTASRGLLSYYAMYDTAHQYSILYIALA